MDFNRAEISTVRELLVNLVHALAPLAGEESLSKRDTEFLASHIFIPRESSSALPDYEVRLLTTLQTAQKQITKWVPPEVKKEAAKSGGKEKGGPVEKAPSQLSPESPTSVASQARSLIAQVRNAIQLLSSSSNLDRPESKAFKKAMEPLKDLVDSLIEAVKRKEMGSSDQRKPSFPFRPLPKSPREDLIKKTVPLPSFQKEEKPLPPKKTFRPTEKQETPSFFSRSTTKEKERETPFSRENIPSTKSAKPKEEKAILPQPEGKFSAEDKKPFISSQERTSLPGAPYLAAKPLFSKLKKKKKRKKGLWPEKDEDSSLT